MLAIESKCTEHFAHKPAKFRQSYHDRITDGRRDSVWFRELERLSAEPSAYRHLDAAQLVKHALGLGFTYPDRAVTLLYLDREPDNPEALPEIAIHRREPTSLAVLRATASRSRARAIRRSVWSASGVAWVEAHVGRLGMEASGSPSSGGACCLTERRKTQAIRRFPKSLQARQT